MVSPILTVIPLQLLACHLAVELGRDVDKPGIQSGCHPEPGRRRGSGRAPNSKLQAPEKLQAPNFKGHTSRCFGAWLLELLWSLVLGAWCFRSAPRRAWPASG